MAGNTAYSFLVDVAKAHWIIDTGATNHMVADLSLLSNIKAVDVKDTKKVNLPNGEIAHVTHIGNCRITGTWEVKNVLFIPDFQYNLMSVSKVTRVLRCLVAFYPDFCLFRTSSLGR